MMTAARDNPFRVERLHRLRYRAADHDWLAVMRKLEAQRYCGAIVGPHGTGKTTMFLELRGRLESAGWCVRHHRLSMDDLGGAVAMSLRMMDAADARTIVMLDGADLLGRFGWWRVHRRWHHSGAKGFVITSHRQGLLPTLLQTGTSLAVTHELVGELVGERAAETMKAGVARLYDEHRGNVRDVLRSLYDAAARGQVRV